MVPADLTSSAPSAAPPGGSGPLGAVTAPSQNNAGGGAPTATPPMGAPVAQNVPARGANAARQLTGGLVLRGLMKMLSSDLNPQDDEYKSITRAIDLLAKHYVPAPAGAPTQQPRMAAPGGALPMGGPGGPMPQMSGGPQAGMTPPGPPPMPQG